MYFVKSRARDTHDSIFGDPRVCETLESKPASKLLAAEKLESLLALTDGFAEVDETAVVIVVGGDDHLAFMSDLSLLLLGVVEIGGRVGGEVRRLIVRVSGWCGRVDLS